MTLKKTKRLCWSYNRLESCISCSLLLLKNRKKTADETSPWWGFIFSWQKEKNNVITSFIKGDYIFEPLNHYSMPDEALIVWTYRDRLFVRFMLFLIKPMFKYIISSKCLHLMGPSGVWSSLDLVKKAFDNGTFNYFMRVDISSYYASINRKILSSQVGEIFKDKRLLNYLLQIINIPILKDGAITNSLCGIPRRSSLSPFFGALYLSELDRVFENLTNVFYLRFMDDILILAKTKRQFCNAKRRLKNILAKLKLKFSRTKTKMGELTKGFHFLGVDFKVNKTFAIPKAKEVEMVETQIQPLKTQSVSISLHERCCVRAFDKVAVMKEDSVHPDKVQRYLSRWALWWTRAMPSITQTDCLVRWTLRAKLKQPSLAWLGSGLLYSRANYYFGAGRGNLCVKEATSSAL